MNEDIKGQRFGRWVAVSPDPATTKRWLFRCDCGNGKSVILAHVRSGRSTSCGCYRAEVTRIRNSTHGLYSRNRSAREIRAYEHAKARCHCPTDRKYPLYGGRGIIMCQEWRDSIEAFINYMGPCPPGMSIDRIDVNGNYEPGNCRWATPKQQSRNTTRNIYVEHGGRKMALSEFVEIHGVNYGTVINRIRKMGMTPQDAVSTPLLRGPRKGLLIKPASS